VAGHSVFERRCPVLFRIRVVEYPRLKKEKVNYWFTFSRPKKEKVNYWFTFFASKRKMSAAG
jgi:hypothetical protein